MSKRGKLGRETFRTWEAKNASLEGWSEWQEGELDCKTDLVSLWVS